MTNRRTPNQGSKKERKEEEQAKLDFEPDEEPTVRSEKVRYKNADEVYGYNDEV